MKINCKKIEHISHSTECEVVDFCCKKMRQVFSETWKMSHSDGSGYWDNAFRIDECGIMIPVRMSCSYDEHVAHRETIIYCPFCGSLIE